MQLTEERINGVKLKLSYLRGKIVVVVLFPDGGTDDCARHGGVVGYSGAVALRATVTLFCDSLPQSEHRSHSQSTL